MWISHIFLGVYSQPSSEYVHLSLSLPWTQCPNSLLWQWSSGSTLKRAGMKDRKTKQNKEKKTLTVGFYWLNHFGGILGVVTKSGTHFTDLKRFPQTTGQYSLSFLTCEPPLWALLTQTFFFNIKQQLYVWRKMNWLWINFEVTQSEQRGLTYWRSIVTAASCLRLHQSLNYLCEKRAHKLLLTGKHDGRYIVDTYTHAHLSHWTKVTMGLFSLQTNGSTVHYYPIF